MRTSTDRILTTHTGSLPRPSWLAGRHDEDSVRAAVAETVRRQLDAGVDVVSDGEVSKPGYATYVSERLSGFDGERLPAITSVRGADEYPELAARTFGDPAVRDALVNPACTGPVAYRDTAPAEADIAHLTAAAGEATEAFVTAASPGVIAMFHLNRYYPSEEDYLLALADAMKTEYDLISQAGLVLQVDCPDLAAGWSFGAQRTTGEFRKDVARRLEVLDYATRDVPPGQLRLHLCWGNYEGPHTDDVPLADIIDLVLQARPSAVSFEAANPRHEHEWTVFENVRPPEGKTLIPGVIDSTTNYVEHPQLVARRLARYAELVGREHVLAGSDCGFATFAGYTPVDPGVAWAKLAAMAEGARLASQRLW